MNYETYSLSIDEVRKIIKTIEIKDSNRKSINISFYIASEEAQNAMLKMLEDHEDTQFIITVSSAETLLPTVRSRLIDITHIYNNKKKVLSVEDLDKKNEINILEKLKGNLLIIKSKNREDNIYKDLINKYIKMSVMERLKCKEVEEMLNKEVDTGLKNKEIKSKDDIHQFLIAIVDKLLELYKEDIYIKNKIENDRSLNEIKEKNGESKKENLKEQISQFNTLAEYIIKPGSSAKMIMEYVAYRLHV